MHSLAERVLTHIRGEDFLRPGDRIGIAVSGGIDSVALLRLLLELRHDLGIVLCVVHFNHKLRGAESDADQAFVAKLATEHSLEFRTTCGDVAALAAGKGSGLEAAARELRYDFFRSLLLDSDAPLDKIATGHTLDDQAETVLLRLIRGTGLRGLSGIYPRVVIEDDEDTDARGEIIRPLLTTRRRALERYLTDIKQPWREDSSNVESRFTRNRLRSLVMPILEREFNPAVAENLSELAEIARDEEDYWQNEISGWLGTVVQWSEPEWTQGIPGFSAAPSLVQISPSQPEQPDPELLERLNQPGPAVMNASVSRPWLLTEPKAVQRRVLKAIGDEAGIPLEFKHIEKILRFASEDGPAAKELSLPLGWKLVREAEAIIFVTPDLRRQERIPDYEYSLRVPGRVFIPELEMVIEGLVVRAEAIDAEYNREQLLALDLLQHPLIVRNWRAGDRFFPAHTKSPKKVKELLQNRHIAKPERRPWPVVSADGGEIVWMRGFPVPAALGAKAGQDAILIREIPWREEGVS